jgi:hypothetical protein
LALLLGSVRNVATSQQTRNQSNQSKPYEQGHSAQNQQPIPPVYADILDSVRALVSEEVAKRKQDHADHDDWDTKPFWIMFGLNAALIVVGTAYTIVAYCQLGAIGKQGEIAKNALILQFRPSRVLINP